MTHVRLIHWNAAEREERADFLRAAGCRVGSGLASVPVLLNGLKIKPPDAIIIDLSRLPSQGRDLGLLLRKSAARRAIPLIFVGGDQENTARVRKLLPDAVYAKWGTIRLAIRKAVAHPPEHPIVPNSVFAAYAGVSLPKKLGIKPNTLVALVDAPSGFQKKLTPLPKDVRLIHRATSDSELTIWFNTSEKEMKKGPGRIAESVGSGRVWIVWSKKKGNEATDLTQTVVREEGLAAGLVDYKICSLDETWSGLLFTRRRPGTRGKRTN